eukprot:s2438_g7.t1
MTSASSSRPSALRTSKKYKEQDRGRSVTKSDKPPKREKGKEKKGKKEKKANKKAEKVEKVDKVQKVEKAEKAEKAEKVEKSSVKKKERSVEEELALAVTGKKKKELEEAKTGEKRHARDKTTEKKTEKKTESEKNDNKNGASAQEKKKDKKEKTKDKKPEKTQEKKVTEDSSKEKDEGHKSKKAKVEDEVKEGGKKKKGQTEKDSKTGEEGAERKKRKKEPPIVYEPVSKPEIEHIFTTPDKPTRKAPPSVGGSESTEMTSREKALQRMHELTKNLESSDDEEGGSCPTTDLEAFLDEQKQHDSETDDEGDESEAESEEDEEQDEDSDDSPGEDEEEKDDEKDEEEDESGEEKSPSTTDSEEQDDTSSSESAAETEKKEDEKKEDEKKEDEKKEGKEDDKDSKVAEPGAPTTAEASAPTAAAPAREHALVPVTEATQSQQVALRNSVTHKPEWEKYIRQAKTMMPIQCNELFTSNKKELFNLWLDSNQDWEQCRLSVERKHQQRNIASRGWVAKQGKELKKQYTPEKWESVKASRKNAGLYYEDDDFPGDDDDTGTCVRQNFLIYFIKSRVSFQQFNTSNYLYHYPSRYPHIQQPIKSLVIVVTFLKMELFSNFSQ